MIPAVSSFLCSPFPPTRPHARSQTRWTFIAAVHFFQHITFFSSFILALTNRKMPLICTLSYFIFSFPQLYSCSYPLTTGYSFTLWLHTPPKRRKSKLALFLPQSPCHGTFLLPPGLSCTLVHPTSWCPAPCSPLWSLSASLARTFFCTLQPFRRSSHAHVQHQEIAFASHQVEKGVTDIYQGHLWGKRSKMKYKLTLYSSLKCECAILLS